jgi:hypothetical protein
VHAASRDARTVRWVRRQAQHARRVASVCTGAFLLAEAGLLDGRRAVTHWARCDEFAARYPNVRVEPDPIFIRDGALWTSAGVTAGIDLALALVEEDLGRAIALDAARELVVFLKRPGGQAQFSAMLSMQRTDDRFGELHAWIAEHLAADLSVPALAERVSMSERSFVRHYRAGTGRPRGRSNRFGSKRRNGCSARPTGRSSGSPRAAASGRRRRCGAVSCVCSVCRRRGIGSASCGDGAGGMLTMRLPDVVGCDARQSHGSRAL